MGGSSISHLSLCLLLGLLLLLLARPTHAYGSCGVGLAQARNLNDPGGALAPAHGPKLGSADTRSHAYAPFRLTAIHPQAAPEGACLPVLTVLTDPGCASAQGGETPQPQLCSLQGERSSLRVSWLFEAHQFHQSFGFQCLRGGQLARLQAWPICRDMRVYRQGLRPWDQQTDMHQPSLTKPLAGPCKTCVNNGGTYV